MEHGEAFHCGMRGAVWGVDTLPSGRPNRLLEGKMTKKHFEWAAEYLATAGGLALNPQAAEALIDLFLEFGPRFDEDRFRAKIDALVKKGIAK